MKKTLFAVVALSMSLGACNIARFAGRGDLAVEHFKTVMPFTLEKDMVIAAPIGLGTHGKTYRFHLDTHAPESGFSASSDVANRNDIHFLGNSELKIRTTSGEKIDRQYYKADSLYLGKVLVTDVSLIKIPGEQGPADTTFPVLDGILGTSLLRMGVWKIDFEHNQITFASSMDSIDSIDDKRLFAKSDLFDMYKTTVKLNGLEKKVSVDLGTNAHMLLALDDMKQLTDFSAAERKEGNQKTAAGLSKVVSYRLPNEPATINGEAYTLRVLGMEAQNTAVIGLGFFKQFKYVVIDYPGHKMYVSANKLTPQYATK